MKSADAFKKANMYQQMGAHSEVNDASPHRLIQMLLEGALGKIAQAKGCLERDDVQGISNNISMAIAIVDGLRMSLDKSVDNSIVTNLDDLYDYAGRRLLEANVKRDVIILDDVSNVLREIKEGWDAIAPNKQQSES